MVILVHIHSTIPGTMIFKSKKNGKELLLPGTVTQNTPYMSRPVAAYCIAIAGSSPLIHIHMNV